MKEIFAKNLKRARELKGWKQEIVAGLIGMGRPAYGAYEEGRAFPSEEVLIAIAKTFDIVDLIGFISNENFDITQQLPRSIPASESLVERKYKEAGIREKLAVNILLGLVDLT